MKMIWMRLTGALERMDCHQSQNEFQMRANTASTMMTPIAMPTSSMIMPVGPPSEFRRGPVRTAAVPRRCWGRRCARRRCGCRSRVRVPAPVHRIRRPRNGRVRSVARGDQHPFGAGADGKPLGDVPVARIGGDLGLGHRGPRGADPRESPPGRERRPEEDDDHAHPARRIVGDEREPDRAGGARNGPDEEQPERDHEYLQDHQNGRRGQQAERPEKRRPVDLHSERSPRAEGRRVGAGRSGHSTPVLGRMSALLLAPTRDDPDSYEDRPNILRTTGRSALLRPSPAPHNSGPTAMAGRA